MMREELSEKVETVYAEEYAWPLSGAVLLLIVEALIGEAPRRRPRPEAEGPKGDGVGAFDLGVLGRRVRFRCSRRPSSRLRLGPVAPVRARCARRESGGRRPECGRRGERGEPPRGLPVDRPVQRREHRHPRRAEAARGRHVRPRPLPLSDRRALRASLRRRRTRRGYHGRSSGAASRPRGMREASAGSDCRSGTRADRPSRPRTLPSRQPRVLGRRLRRSRPCV